MRSLVAWLLVGSRTCDRERTRWIWMWTDSACLPDPGPTHGRTDGRFARRRTHGNSPRVPTSHRITHPPPRRLDSDERLTSHQPSDRIAIAPWRGGGERNGTEPLSPGTGAHGSGSATALVPCRHRAALPGPDTVTTVVVVVQQPPRPRPRWPLPIAEPAGTFPSTVLYSQLACRLASCCPLPLLFLRPVPPRPHKISLRLSPGTGSHH